jgi:hypothetical protein
VDGPRLGQKKMIHLFWIRQIIHFICSLELGHMINFIHRLDKDGRQTGHIGKMRHLVWLRQMIHFKYRLDQLNILLRMDK